MVTLNYIHGSEKLHQLSHQTTWRHSPKDYILTAARTLSLTLQPPLVQHTNVSVYAQQYKDLLRNKFISYTAFLNFILFCVFNLQILQRWLTYYWGHGRTLKIHLWKDGCYERWIELFFTACLFVCGVECLGFCHIYDRWTLNIPHNIVTNRMKYRKLGSNGITFCISLSNRNILVRKVLTSQTKKLENIIFTYKFLRQPLYWSDKTYYSHSETLKIEIQLNRQDCNVRRHSSRL
jgi:hypothetical protein